jgi:hypothetical protein
MPIMEKRAHLSSQAKVFRTRCAFSTALRKQRPYRGQPLTWHFVIACSQLREATMQRPLTRLALLLVSLLTVSAAATVPSEANPQEQSGGWGQQAVAWCRDGHADGSKPFGQCVSKRVHELKGASGARGHGPKAKAGKQAGKGKGQGAGQNKKNK